MKKNKTIYSSIIIISLIFASCANPFGEGTWRPLPFKKWQKKDSTKVSPKR